MTSLRTTVLMSVLALAHAQSIAISLDSGISTEFTLPTFPSVTPFLPGGGGGAASTTTLASGTTTTTAVIVPSSSEAETGTETPTPSPTTTVGFGPIGSSIVSSILSQETATTRSEVTSSEESPSETSTVYAIPTTSFHTSIVPSPNPCGACSPYTRNATYTVSPTGTVPSTLPQFTGAAGRVKGQWVASLMAAGVALLAAL